MAAILTPARQVRRRRIIGRVRGLRGTAIHPQPVARITLVCCGAYVDASPVVGPVLCAALAEVHQCASV